MNTNAFFADKHTAFGSLSFEKSEASGIYLPAKTIVTPSLTTPPHTHPLTADAALCAQNLIVTGGSLHG